MRRRTGSTARLSLAGVAVLALSMTGGTRGGPQTSVQGIVDLAGNGYVEEEYFLIGTASSYAKAAGSTWGSDGIWAAQVAAATAPFKTRILVRRPADPQAFNGTVVVEWMNVTGQADGAPDFTEAQGELLRGGYAWVGVSAQALGLNQPLLGLKVWDPTRYGTLSHPGDSYSYDIFSQAGQALRTPVGSDPLGNLRSTAARYLAFGESQSAGRLVTYINAVHPLVNVFDGFFVHSRGAGGAALSTLPATTPVPSPAPIRTDLSAPVFQVETETDVAGYSPARQADTNRIRTWEVAGAAHFDHYGLSFIELSTAKDFPGLPSLLPVCQYPVNDASARYVYDAAVHHLDRWVRDGSLPPIGTRISLSTTSPVAPLRDTLGIALGGVRLPEMDVPLLTYSGLDNLSLTPPNFCGLFGTTKPIPAETLAALYPNHGSYVSRVTKATTAAEKAGFILGYDAELIRTAAATSEAGK
jgi:hypothetical protein